MKQNLSCELFVALIEDGEVKFSLPKSNKRWVFDIRLFFFFFFLIF